VASAKAFADHYWARQSLFREALPDLLVEAEWAVNVVVARNPRFSLRPSESARCSFMQSPAACRVLSGQSE
jgi:hypothetical protein